PPLGYAASRIDRAVGIRADEAALKRYCEHPQAGSYVIGGELVALKAAGELCQALFSPAEARDLGSVREIVFLRLADAAPRFGVGLVPDALKRLKPRNDLKVSDLRSKAVPRMPTEERLGLGERRQMVRRDHALPRDRGKIGDFKIIAVQGMVAAPHLPPL